MTVTEAWQQLMIALVDSHDLDGKCDRVRELMGHIRTRKEEMARSVCNLHVLFCTVQVWPMYIQNHVACNVSFNTNCSSCSFNCEQGHYICMWAVPCIKALKHTCCLHATDVSTMLAFSRTQHDLFNSDASQSMHDAECCLATASLASPLLTCCEEQSTS